MTAVTEAPAYGDVAWMPVHFDDLDALGMLHNARYALLVERAMISWWAAHGVSFAGGSPTTPDAFNVVRESAITFHLPVRGTGEVGVHFWVERLGNSSADYRFRFISRDGRTVYAEGKRVVINVDPVSLRPAPWSEDGRATAATLLRS